MWDTLLLSDQHGVQLRSEMDVFTGVLIGNLDSYLYSEQLPATPHGIHVQGRVFNKFLIGTFRYLTT